MEPCKHEKEWGQIQQVITGVVKEIYGNGTKGLAKTVPRLEEKIDNMREDILLLSTSVSGLTKFMSESEGFQKGQQQAQQSGFNAWQRTAMAISGITAITFLIIKIIEIT